MRDKRILVLSHVNKEALNDIGNGYIREFIRQGAFFLDYNEVYFRYGNRKAEKHINDFIKKNGIEILIYASSVDAFHFGINFFERLKDRIFLVMMLGDTDHYFEVRDRYYAQVMDLIVVYDPFSVYSFKKIGVEAIFFPSSYDITKYSKIDGFKKSIDVSFVGAISGKMRRSRYLNHLLSNGVKVEIYGYGSEKGQIPLKEMVELFNRSKINLSFTGVSKTTEMTRQFRIHRRIRQIKGHVAEIALCGGFVLSEYAPGLESLFEIGSEIQVFSCEKELMEKTRYYLEHKEERKTIAERGYRRAVKDYNASRSISSLIATINDLTEGKKYKSALPVYLDNVFIKNYTTYRVYLILKFIKLARWKPLLDELNIIFRYKKLDLYQVRKFLIRDFLSNKIMFTLISSVSGKIKNDANIINEHSKRPVSD